MPEEPLPDLPACARGLEVANLIMACLDDAFALLHWWDKPALLCAAARRELVDFPFIHHIAISTLANAVALCLREGSREHPCGKELDDRGIQEYIRRVCRVWLSRCSWLGHGVWHRQGQRRHRECIWSCQLQYNSRLRQ